jgi:uncharacterized membrane protein
MSRENFLILLGVLVLLSPFAGLPMTWLAWILPILGIFILIVGFTLRRSRKQPENPVAP